MWGLAAGLVEALQAIHAKGLLHRDLKPSNVLLAGDGPRVIDFGIARTLEGTSLTGTGAVIGTPGFMSSEQAEDRRVGTASDVFALGAVLTYAATGNEPFGTGAPRAVLHRVIHQQPHLDAVHGPLHDLITACLAKDPTERPTLPQLLNEITAHWEPPDDVPGATRWPTGVTTLIQRQSITPTTPYTVQPSGSLHHAPTATAPTKEDLTRRFQEASRLGDAGNHAEAARLFAEVATERARVLGPDHPGTLASRHNHAWEIGEAGNHPEAARLFAQVATDCARALGDDHPHTLTSRHNHAWHLPQVEERGGGR
ncbi:Tetratricopeptide repeat-containing protein [Streptomyces zhaozhouensis]|uniref:non-specific serine/threonine protein kinase n=1 Tax=Streptomyces zhaozhouensis TaxID=1300267 RepID=A0A286DWW9_9ACTN|nr:Tetratricopeptide repeat-containing protein [Streptomyces zhaozhouensis]